MKSGLGILLVLSAAAVGGYQCLQWLQDGYWTAIDLRDLTDGPPYAYKYAGAGKIATWLGEQSVAAMLGLAGVVLFIAGANE